MKKHLFNIYSKKIAFKNNDKIPKKYTCEGEDLSPPLQFSDIPQGTVSLSLVVDDPDAPSGTFDHWITWNLPPTKAELKEGEKGPHQGTNGFGKTGYRGPCPPRGKPHRYFFKLYALDIKVNLSEGSSKEDLEEAMEGHILAETHLIGLYQRS